MNGELEKKIRNAVCETMCMNVNIHSRNDGLLAVETPFSFDDGDAYSIYLRPEPTGGVRISDMGHTLMQLSYSMDVDKLASGTRGRVFEEVLQDNSAKYADGEVFVESGLPSLGADLLKFGRLITQLHDIRFMSRARVESTFYEDLEKTLLNIVPPEHAIVKEYQVPSIAEKELYPVDFMIEGKSRPVFLYGVSNTAKARLTTIALLQFEKAAVDFESFIVFSKQEEISRPDVARLTNVGGEMVASLSAHDEFRKKLLRKVAA
jgi:hypothetical protein